MSENDRYDTEGVAVTGALTPDERIRIAQAAAARAGLDPATLSASDLAYLMPPPPEQKLEMTDDEARGRALGAFHVDRPSTILAPVGHPLPGGPRVKG